MTKILDCTTRDGGHDVNWFFTPDFVRNHINNLKKNNINYYEIGYRNFKDREGKGDFYCCSVPMLKQFYSMKGEIKLGVMVDASRFSNNDFPAFDKDYLDFVRVATHPDTILYAIEITEKLYFKGYNVFLQLMEIQNVRNKDYEILENWKNKNILESIYIADTYSKVEPQNIKQYFLRLRKIGFENISFHAHNANDLAYENTVTAINLGAYSVDVSYNGMGENLDMAKLIQ